MMSFKKSIATLTAVIMLMVCVVPAIGSTDATGHFITNVTESTSGTPIGSIQELQNITPAGTYYLTKDLVFTDVDDQTTGGVDIKITANVSGNNLNITVQYDNSGDNSGTFVPADGVNVIVNGDAAILTDTNGVATYTHENGRQYTIVVQGDIMIDSTNVNVVAALYSPNGSSAETIKNSNGNFDAISGFTGTLYGNGYTITGLQVVSSTDPYVGLFRDLGGTVRDLGIIDGYFVSVSDDSSTFTGSFTGKLENGGSINNCFSVSEVISYSIGALSSYSYAGGIVGETQSLSSTIQYCYSIGSVSSVSYGLIHSYAGGIIGKNEDALVSNSYNKSSVGATSHGGYAYAGGIAGEAVGNNVLSYVGNTGEVRSLSGGDGSYSGANGSYSGGVAGSVNGDLSKCYNMGRVYSVSTDDTPSSKSYAGGVVGYISGKIFDCFNTSAVSASGGYITAAGGIAGECAVIYNCYSSVSYNSVTVSTGGKKGGIAGIIADNSTLTNCYFNGTSGNDLYGEGTGIIVDDDNVISQTRSEDDISRSGGKSTAALKSRNTYFKESTYIDLTTAIPGWSFGGGSAWQMNGQFFDGYPYLNVDGWIPGQIVILKQPQDVWKKSGSEEVSFTVVAVSDLNIKYQWQTSSSGGDSGWSDISGETSDTLTITSSKTAYYRCKITTDSILGTGSAISNVFTSSAKLNIYTGEIRTVSDLAEMRNNPSGDYVLMADLDITTDMNGGVDVIMTPTTNSGGDIVFEFTFKDGPSVNGLDVWFNGAVDKTDPFGKVSFTRPSDGKYTVIAGGIVTSQGDPIAVQYDIDMSALEPITKNSNGNFDPIGTYSRPFTGTFDGNGHTITGLEVAVLGTQSYDGSAKYASSGLFGYLEGTVKNLILNGGYSIAVSISDGTNQEAHANAGMIAGTAINSTISGCQVSGTVTSLSYEKDNLGDVRSGSGGIVGMSDGTLSMNMCSNSGNVSAMSYSESGVTSDADAGGLVGSITGSGNNISNGYNTGDIFAYGTAHAGGITGDGGDAMISNCFSTGSRMVDGVQSLSGGISGTMAGGYIINCYFLGESTDGLSDGTFLRDVDIGGGGDSGPKTESQLKDRSTFYTGSTTVGSDQIAGWDFVSGDVWKMDGGFPTLIMVVPDDDGGDGGNDLDPLLIAGIAVAVIVVLLAAYMIYRRRA